MDAGPKSDLIGTWTGRLTVGEASLRLKLSIADGRIDLYSLDQNAVVTATAFTVREGDGYPEYKLSFGGISAEYRFRLVEGRLVGEWFQSGHKAKLAFSTERDEPIHAGRAAKLKGEPRYTSTDVSIPSENGVVLGGTYFAAAGENRPSLIVISGTGSQDRDGTELGRKPYLVLAHHLANMGVDVLRLDDRGVGASSGSYVMAGADSIALDIASAYSYVRSSVEGVKHIGLLGHSDGGRIAAKTIVEHGVSADFLVLMSVPTQRGKDVVLSQLAGKLAGAPNLSSGDQEAIVRLYDTIYQAIASSDQTSAKQNALRAGLEASRHLPKGLQIKLGITEQSLGETLRVLTMPWFVDFLRDDPKDYYARLDIPAMAVFGEKDAQVDFRRSADTLQKLIPEIEIHEYENLDHLLQSSSVGVATEHASPEVIAEQVLSDIGHWIFDVAE